MNGTNMPAHQVPYYPTFAKVVRVSKPVSRGWWHNPFTGEAEWWWRSTGAWEVRSASQDVGMKAWALLSAAVGRGPPAPPPSQ
ncbi:unnamed protein product [Vitrella brassicaformis CCMP3155]|nr:unnamed protein product [Vitrella brassicaformis CCMP3155]|eukprot:CEL91630.1 unnamed protein product [Vitrella brassicaformis CCMP3155]